MHIRKATAADAAFLWEMLGQAAAWKPSVPAPTLDEMRADPELSRYLQGWPRRGDAGVLAVDDRGQPLGAAWYRSFTEGEPGYGWIDAETPEVAIAVRAGFRGGGHGEALLQALAARARQEGVSALSLSVARANPARRLYRRLGYEELPASGDSMTMRLDLAL